MADAGVDQYTFHVEPCSDVLFVCRKVREAGMKVRILNQFILYKQFMHKNLKGSKIILFTVGKALTDLGFMLKTTIIVFCL